jgi:uncharacterized membrane protein YccF (DUF307 family)
LNLIGNLIWLVFGGFISAIGYVIGGVVLCCTIIGIPFGMQCFKLAEFMLWPFGKKAVNGNSGGGCLQTFANIIWILCGGIWIAASHFFFGVLLCITIIGLPFGRKHFQMIEIALMPFGKKIVNA